MKTYKGYELLKAIADGEIKSGAHIRVHTKNYNVDYWFWGNWFGKEDGYSKPLDNIELYLCDKSCTFELIEDEIDIQNIEELVTGYSESGADTDIINFLNNEILPAVKQLDKEVKELKSFDIEVSEKDINKAIEKARNN